MFVSPLDISMNESPKGSGSRGRDEDEAAVQRQRALSSQLRAMFDDVVSEPIPDQFLSLIEALNDDEGGDEGVE